MSVSGQGGARPLQGVHCPEKALSKPGSTPINPETQMCLSRLGACLLLAVVDHGRFTGPRPPLIARGPVPAISEAQRSQNFHETCPAQGRPRSGRCHACHAQISRGRQGLWMPTPCSHPTPSCPKSLSGQLGPGQDLCLGPTSQGRGRQPPSLVWVNKRMTAGAVPGPPGKACSVPGSSTHSLAADETGQHQDPWEPR